MNPYRAKLRRQNWRAQVKTNWSVGHVSLAVAVGGFAVMETALGQNWIAGSFWRIVARSFEAATVGGMADWFAVTALFREVKLPLIRRHTNIIVKNKKQLISGVVDIVQTRWLSPDVIRKRLERLSASKHILDYLGQKKRAKGALSLFRDLLREVVRGIDGPEVVSFLDRAIKDQLRVFDLTGPLGRWIGGVMRRGDHHGIWDTLIVALEKAIDGEEFHTTARRMINRGIKEYKESGIHRKLGTDVLEFFDVLNRDEFVKVLLRKAKETIKDAHENPSHPLRVRLDAALMEFADGLVEGRTEAVSTFEKLRVALLEETNMKEVLTKMLGRLRETLEGELEQPDSDLGRLINRVFRERLDEFRDDKSAQEKVDSWVRTVALDLLEKHHAVIGDMVREKLEGLSDPDLISQIEGKVGKDLQYIRLNGAIVGGLVGAFLAIVRLLY